MEELTRSQLITVGSGRLDVACGHATAFCRYRWTVHGTKEVIGYDPKPSRRRVAIELTWRFLMVHGDSGTSSASAPAGRTEFGAEA
jgi:hypothetical protein